MTLQNQDSTRLRLAIDAIRRDYEQDDLSDEQKDRLAQLATIWASGYLEATCRELLSIYTRQRADDDVLNYVSWHLSRLRSPNVQKVANELRKFNRDMALTLNGVVDDDVKESVNSIIEMRHNIAHGRPARVTLKRALQHFDNAERFTRAMGELLGFSRGLDGVAASKPSP